MRKIRCQFNMDKDWVKAGLVFAYGIVDNENLEDTLSSVYKSVLTDEFGDNLEGLGPSANDKIDAILATKDLVTTFCSIYDDAKYVQSKNPSMLHELQLRYIKVLDEYQKKIDSFFDAKLNEFATNYLPMPIESESNQEYTSDKLESINNDMDGDLSIEESSDRKPDNVLEDSIWSASSRSIVIENDIDFDSSISSDSDVSHKLFKGKMAAKEDFVKKFNTDIVSRAVISTNPSNPKVFSSNIDIDRSIKEYKNELFNKVFGEPLYVGDGEQKPMRPDFKQKINDKIEEYNNMNDGKGLLAKDIDAMIVNSDRTDYEKFISFAILKNFDSLIKIYGNKMVNIKENSEYMPDILGDNSEKYYFKKTINTAVPFSTNDFVDAMSKVSGVAKMFIESTPEINDDGFEVPNKYLRIDRVFNISTKLGKLISRVNHFESLKSTLEDVIKKNQGVKGYSRELDNIDISIDEMAMVKSLYAKFFKDEDSLINGKLGRFGNNLLKNYNKLSFYEVLKAEYNNGNMPMNLVDVIGSTFAKTIALKYDEVSFSPETKENRIKNLEDSISRRQSFLLNRSLSASIFTANSKTSSSIMARYSSEVDLDKYKVKVTLPSGVELIHNVIDGKTVDIDGNEFDFTSILVPEIVSLDVWKTPGIYSDYMFLLSAFQTITKQQLKGLDSAVINTFRKKVDGETKNNKHIGNLMSIMSNSLFIHKLISERIPNGITENEADIAEAINTIPEIDADELYNKRSRLFNISFNRYSKASVGLLADAMAIVNGDKSKSVIKNSEGNSLPVYGPVNLINDVKSLVDLVNINRSKFQRKIPLENNIFIQSPDLLKGLSVRTNYENNGKSKSSAKLSEGETIVVDILYSYGDKKVTDGNPAFQPTVFSDKTKHSGVEVNGNSELTFIDENTGEQKTKKYSEMNSDEFKSLHYQSQHSYYSNLEESMVKTYSEVFTNHDAVSSYLDLTKVLKHTNIVSYDGNVLEIKKHAKKFDGKTIKEEINKLEQIHKAQQAYRKRGRFNNINDAAAFVSSVTDKQLLSLAKQNTNRPIVVELLFTKGDGTAIVNPLLVERFNMYRPDYSKDSDGYNKMMDSAKRVFAEKLERGFNVDYVDDYGTENGLVNEIYEKFGVDKTEWINSYTKRVVPFKKVGDNIVLNPFIEQYFWEHNAISENFQNLTVGTIFGHKGNNEAKKTIAMLKRMVAHQATFHPYYNGSLNGVNHITKTIYVKDPQAYLQNVMGMKKEDQEITDGGSAISMLESILKNNSLMDQAVAIHKKDIGMTIDPYYNAAGLMKHASHALSNEDIRRTIGSTFDLKVLVNKLYRGEPVSVADGKVYQWNIDGIPINLDITRDFNNRFIGDIESLNPMFKDGYYYINKIDDGTNRVGDIIRINRIAPVSSIESEGQTIVTQPNVYTITKQNISRGTDASMTNVPINNLADLWNVFGAEQSVTIDDNGRFSADGINFSYSDASHYVLAEFANRVGFWRNTDSFGRLLQQTVGRQSKSGVTVTDNQSLRKLTDMLTTVDEKRVFDPKSDVANQASIFQPIKLNHIGMVNFASGQKVGAKNINNPSVLTSDEDFWVSETNNLHTGVQLDYEHETDDSHVTEMTQIISAMIFNGDTRDIALNTYSAIGEYVKDQLSSFIESANNPSLDSQRKSWLQLADVIIKKQGQDKSSLQGMILSVVETSIKEDKNLISSIEKARQAVAAGTNQQIVDQATADLASYMKTSFNLPMSDSSLFGTAFSTLANHFTAAAIRRKFEGGGLIISGLSGFIELQDLPNIDMNADGLLISNHTATGAEGFDSWVNKITHSKYYRNKLKEGISHDDIINGILRQEVDASNVLIGDTVVYNKNGSEVRETLTKFSDYLDFKNSVKPTDKVIIDRSVKRQLRPLNWTWTSANNRHNLYDQPQVKSAYLFDDYLSLLTDVISKRPSKMESDEKSNTKKEKQEADLSKFELDLRNDDYIKSVNAYIQFCQKYGSYLSGLGFDDMLAITSPKDIVNLTDLKNVKQVKAILKLNIRNECKDIDEGKMSINDDLAYMILNEKEKFSDLYPDMSGLINDTANLKSVDEIITYCANRGIKVPISNLVANPMEVGLPNMNASKYGLPKDIDISEVTQETFENQELSRIKSSIKYYDMYLRDINGRHLYVFVRGSKNHKNIIKSGYFKEADDRIIMKDGKRCLMNPATGTVEYEVGKSQFGFISQNGRINEAIIVDDIDDLKLLVYNTTEDQKKYANLIVNYAVKDKKLLDFAIDYKLSLPNSDVDKSMLETAKGILENKALPEAKSTEGVTSILSNLNKQQLDGLRIQAKKNAKYRYSSFKESLKYTVARIKY